MFRLFVVVFALCLIKDAFPAPAKKDHCSDGMDIAFILDDSGSTGSIFWEKMLNISKKIVDTFGASEDGNHYAVMTFSNKPQIEMKFNKYNGTDLTSEKIKGDIDGLQRRTFRGSSFIDRALLAAGEKLFTVKAGMRKTARKVAVVLTDGVQTVHRGPVTPLDEVSKWLQSKDVEVYPIGVGADLNVFSLFDMATSEDNVITERGFFNRFSEFKKIFCKSN